MWLVPGALALGGGVWTMHFIGMLAMSLPCGIAYDPFMTLLSMVPGILASAVALWVIGRAELNIRVLILGGGLMGGGIGLMHYTGMAAMRLDAVIYYSPIIFAVSIVFAVVMAILSLYATFALPQKLTNSPKWALSGLSAILMGFAISGMHYIGMEAAYFIPAGSTPTAVPGISPTLLAVSISTVTALLIALALVATFLGKHLDTIKALKHEIKGRRRAEQELQTMRGHAENILEGAAEAVISIDVDQNIIAFNQAAAVIFGYGKAEIIGKQLDLLLPKGVENIHAELVHRFGDSETEARRMGERSELYARRKNDELFPAEVSISKQETPTGRVYTAILKDVSRRTQAEHALRESEERFRALAYNTPNKLHIKDIEGRYINRTSEQLFGVTNEQARGKTAADISPSEMGEAFDEHTRAVIETREPIETEEELTLDDGDHTYLTVKFPIWGADGDIVAVGSSGFEITERKREEAELIQHRDHLETMVNDRTAQVKEKAAQLEDALLREQEYSALQQKFTALVSHDLRTPLTIIDGAAQRLLRNKDKLGPDEVEVRANNVRSAVARMISLIDTTLHASSLDAGKIELKLMPLDIGNLIRKICDRQAEISPSHMVQVELADLPGEIIADHMRLDQVFTNLLSNAVKYAPQAPLIEVKGWTDGGDVLVSVVDHGIGIPENDLPHMFKRFFRAKTAEGIAGTGIGLNVVKEFVEMHGGSIDVASVEGEGSTFTVRLPINGAGQ